MSTKYKSTRRQDTVSSSRNRHVRRSSPAFLPLLLLGGILVSSPDAGFAQDGVEIVVSDVRNTVAEWVNVRQKIAEVEANWKLNKELIADRIALKKDEIADLREKIKDLEVETEKYEADMAGRLEVKMQLQETVQRADRAIQSTAERVAALLPSLPDPVRESLAPVIEKFQQGSLEGDGARGAKLLTILGILNGVEKFNRQISAVNEIRMDSQGSTMEVTTLYLGLGAAYYSSKNGDTAGAGMLGDSGWSWRSLPESADEIKEAVRMYRNERSAQYVLVPVEIR